jgi:hypothetical protein
MSVPPRRLRSALTATSVLLLAAVTGCGSTGDDAGTPNSGGEASAAAAGEQVPDGVVHEYATMAEEIEAEGGETTQGQWRIGYIVEPAEPWFEASAGEQVRRDPADGETHHIEILPFEEATGRLVPDVPIKLEVIDASGQVVDAKDLEFLYGEFFHYANNFSVPEAGEYTLRATVDAPTFLRHGEEPQDLTLTEGVTVEFTDVTLAQED